FVYFLQKKGFLDRGDHGYLRDKLEASRAVGEDLYFKRFLQPLFFVGFAKPEAERSDEVRQLLGEIRYLDGSLFLPHRIEIDNPEIRIPDQAFENMLGLFERYSWNLDDTPGGQDDEINPDVLGYIFEKYINQKAFGAYYTRPEITEYLCEQTLYRLILDRVNKPDLPGLPARRFETIEELLLKLDTELCRELLHEILPSLSILDPACGSGAFLVAALKTLINVYSAVVGKIQFLKDSNLKGWLEEAQEKHRSLQYYIKKLIITDNLFGVDIMEEATEIAKLRLFLTLVSSATSVEELEPLPNIDFNILAGNSLIGLLHVEADAFQVHAGQGNLFQKSYSQLLDEKNRLINTFRHTSRYADDLQTLRTRIEEAKAEALPALNQILLGEFNAHKIKYQQATWDFKKNRQGKPKKRPATLEDIKILEPFHWGYEFDRVLKRGGFDAILTNPPWEKWKPEAKEFFLEHSDLVTKNRMTIKEFQKEQAKLLKKPEIREAWLGYLSRFPHVSLFFRNTHQYKNQIAIVNGRKTGSDINLYKLFLEQCWNLLRTGGRCGILLPTGVYSDLGATQLRSLLFSQSTVQTVFGLSNERFLFEGVHHSFRMCLLTFEKGGETSVFEAAFRVNPREAISAERLELFLHNSSEHLKLSTKLIQRFSPHTLALMEWKSAEDIRIAEKTFKFPLLGQAVKGSWNLVLATEFHMTNDSHLFRVVPRGGQRLPLVEGKMIHQFSHQFARPKYWIDEEEARAALLGKKENDTGQKLAYQKYRLAFRDVARDSDERTMIATVLPPNVFCPHTMSLEAIPRGGDGLDAVVRLYLLALFNSYLIDYLLRFRVTNHLSFFLVYSLPVPRLRAASLKILPFVERALRLCCTTSKFSALWEEVMKSPWSPEVAATEPQDRLLLRGEIDGLVAHLYGLTEEELTHVLSTFPVVPQETKDAALAAYRSLAPETEDPELKPILIAGESARVEFKSTARWDLKQAKKNPVIEEMVLKTVAGFLNAEGGTLLIGVDDAGSAVGLELDYKTLGKKKNRDGFELFLTGLLLGKLGKDLSPCLSVTFHVLGGKDICRVEVSPAPRPTFVPEKDNEVFYLRTSNSTRKLTAKELLDYAKGRWPNG
ncbi:MAG: ATP-binding protein, partial [bacterium]|nr:ATP-binding protein [bacterium]